VPSVKLEYVGLKGEKARFTSDLLACFKQGEMGKYSHEIGFTVED
jgi:hypothetical protein